VTFVRELGGINTEFNACYNVINESVYSTVTGYKSSPLSKAFWIIALSAISIDCSSWVVCLLCGCTVYCVTKAPLLAFSRGWIWSYSTGHLMFVGMHNFPGVRPANRANLRANPGPRLAFAPQGPLPPGFVGRGHCPPHFAPPAIHGMSPYYPAGYQQMAIPHGWIPQTGSFPLEYTTQYGPRLFGAGEGTECTTGEHTKSSERKSKVSAVHLRTVVH